MTVLRFVWVLGVILISTASLSASEPPPSFFGRVASITPANSLILETGQQTQQQVVLAFISIPAGSQPYADQAHAVLTENLVGERVAIRPVGAQESDYLLGIVYQGSTNINLAMLQQGHAWADYLQIDHPLWNRTQNRARAAGIGLFADPDAVHPRRWREQADQARALVGATERMAADPAFPEIMRNSYVAHRGEMLFVPLNCVEVWSQWPRSVRAPVTSLAGAEFRGYRPVPCEAAGNPPENQ